MNYCPVRCPSIVLIPSGKFMNLVNMTKMILGKSKIVNVSETLS